MIFYFHIGQAKTGTSAIQSFLNCNRKLLATKYSILYPNFDEDDFSEGDMHNHGQFVKQTINNPEICISKFRNCIKYAIGKEITTVIISYEGYELVKWPELIAKIIRELNIEYRIILYLRRQDTYLEAAWKQWGHKVKGCNNIQDFKKRSNLKWFETTERWLHHLDNSAFIVRPYEKKVIGDDIVKDFLRIFNINDTSGFSTPESNFLNENHGLSAEVIEILRICSISVDDPNNHDYLNFIYRSLSEKFKKPPMESYQILSPTERIQIISEYTPSNNKLAEIFWGKGKPLFNDPLPDIKSPWFQNSGLTLEKVIPIFMEILISQSQWIDYLRQQNQKLPSLQKDLKSLSENIAMLMNNTENNLDLLKNKNQYKLFPTSNVNSPSEELVLLKKQIEILHQLVFQNQIFYLLPKEILHKSEFVQHISISKKSDEYLELIITGDDPQILLPAYKLSKHPFMLIIEITTINPGKAQIFYQTSRCKHYSESNSITHSYPSGRNTISFIIHEYDLKAKLRLDFEDNNGIIKIHSICGKN